MKVQIQLKTSIVRSVFSNDYATAQTPENSTRNITKYCATYKQTFLKRLIKTAHPKIRTNA